MTDSTPDQNKRHAEKMAKVQTARAKMMAEKTVTKGLIIVHTGTGKGKSSSAFGMIMRCIGHGFPCALVQFIKGARVSADRQLLEDRFSDICQVYVMGEGFTWDTQDRERDIAAAGHAWEKAKELIRDPNNRMVLLDHMTRGRVMMGVGPGAHSYLAGSRFHNLRSPREYIRRMDSAGPARAGAAVDTRMLEEMPAVESVETIERPMEMTETMMMGLRLDTGIVEAEFVARFGRSLSDVYAGVIPELQQLGLVEAKDGVVRLTGRGRLLGNEVFSRFFEPQ